MPLIKANKDVVTLTATDVGLGNVTNESKATMFTNPTFTGTVSGVTATHVGLGNVTNESKATMFTNPTFVAPALGTPASGNLANCTFPTLNQNTTGSSGSIANTGGWSITPSGTTLFFAYNGVNVAKLDSLGNLTVKAEVTAYGTV